MPNCFCSSSSLGNCCHLATFEWRHTNHKNKRKKLILTFFSQHHFDFFFRYIMSRPRPTFSDMFAIRRQNATEASPNLDNLKLQAMQPTSSEANTESTFSDTVNTVLGDYSDTARIYFSSVEQLFQEYHRLSSTGHSGFVVHGKSAVCLSSSDPI